MCASAPLMGCPNDMTYYIDFKTKATVFLRKLVYDGSNIPHQGLVSNVRMQLGKLVRACTVPTYRNTVLRRSVAVVLHAVKTTVYVRGRGIQET